MVEQNTEVNALLARVRTTAARVEALTEQLSLAEKDLREDAVAARKGGALVRDIQQASGWSHDKLNRVLREGGIAPDRSAPRK